MSWMAWTLPSVLFFIVIACMLIIMTILEVLRPCTERKGFLPIRTTRGDRFFIGLLGSAYIHFFFIGLTDLPIWYPFSVAILWFIVILGWG